MVGRGCLCILRQHSENVEESVTVFTWNTFIWSTLRSRVHGRQEQKTHADAMVDLSSLPVFGTIERAEILLRELCC